MMFRVDLFKARLAESNKSVRDVANILGCNESTLYRKMSGESDFTRNEIQLFRQAFDLSPAEVEAIFFATELA